MDNNRQGSDRPDSDGSRPEILGKSYIKQQLGFCLSTMCSARTFATFQFWLHMSNPGLMVKGVGIVGLPLSPRDARAIVAVCRHASFNEDAEIIVNDSVHKVSELNEEQFEIQNPAWQTFVESVKHQVINELEVDDSVSEIKAQPRVLCEVKPLTSGYRLVLTYNLVHTNLRFQRYLPDMNDTTEKMRNILMEWKRASEQTEKSCPRVLAYRLRNTYIARYDSMESGDQFQVHHLKNMTSKHGFSLYLANLTCVLNGKVSHNDKCPELDETCRGPHYLRLIDRRSLALTYVTDLSGNEQTGGLRINKDDFVLNDLFDGEPDEQKCTGYHHDQAAEADHVYYHTAVIIVPTRFRMDLFFQRMQAGHVDVSRLIRQLFVELEEPEPAASAREDLARLCKLITTHNRQFRGDFRSRRFSDYALGLVAKACVMLADEALFEKSVFACIEHLPLETYADIGRLLGIGEFFEFEKGDDSSEDRIDPLSLH
ncbi:MAG: hypothetical protein M1833_003260 [Piccolia ochrophora]|nr:MAG: hypothetical protein M1833_003260 [Piccolia ochrophora]